MLARRASGVQAASVPNLALECDDTSNAAVDFASNVFVTGSNDRSVTAWVYITDSTSNNVVFMMGSDAAGSYKTWRIRAQGYLRIEFDGGGSTSSLAIPEDTWTFIAVVMDGPTHGDNTMYVNSSSEAASGSTTIATSSAFAGLGHYLEGGAGNICLNGQLDDVRVYNRALTGAELTTLYNNRGGAVVQSGLIGWYKFDEGTADTAASGTDSIIDSSGNGNHGTPYNSPYYRAV